MRALVTDAAYKNGLCAVRSLGRRGAYVVSGAARRLAPGSYTRYSAERVVYPAPEREDEFVSFVAGLVRRRGLDVVLPLSDVAIAALARNRSAIEPHAALPLADWPAIELAGDKRRAIELARSLGVPTPRTFAAPADVDVFPVVVKAPRGSGRVTYANDAAALEAAVAADPGAAIQEYVPGEGFGFFGLFGHGVEQAVFMHRRVREFPVTGGASTAAESVDDPVLRELGLRLLRSLGWHGVAMAEFRRDARDGVYRLIEINPKFWGSLDLAVAAGVDFPWLAARLALGEEVGPPPVYEVGLRHRWVFDDLLHAAARPSAARAVLGDALDRSVRSDFELRDPLPSLLDAGRFAAVLTRRAITGSLRRPHGEPRTTLVNTSSRRSALAARPKRSRP